MEQKTVMGPKQYLNAINSWVTGVGGGGIWGLRSIELVDKRGNQKV